MVAASNKRVRLPTQKRIAPPDRIDAEYFVITHDHTDNSFMMSFPDGGSYDLGEYIEAETYLKRALSHRANELWCEDCIARVQAFYAVQVIPNEGLLIQVDLPQTKTISDVLRELFKNGTTV